MDQHIFGLLSLATQGLVVASIILASPARGTDAIAKYCRFQHGGQIAYGIVEGDRVRRLDGDLLADWSKSDQTFALDEVQLLVPTRPTQVLAMAGNYKSHLSGQVTTTLVTTEITFRTESGTDETTTDSKTTVETRRPGEVPAKFQTPQPFFKSPSCLVPHNGTIVLPAGAESVHYEAEMVIVIGRRAKDVSRDAAADYVLGVTCGNDVSARRWQANDVQWWRAKGSDTFGPCGPFIVSGLDYDNLLLELRLNGETRQQERTSQLIHDVASIVSGISQNVTLHPGDLIFTGTPGETAELASGDVVEAELEGVGVLKNQVVAE